MSIPLIVNAHEEMIVENFKPVARKLKAQVRTLLTVEEHCAQEKKLAAQAALVASTATESPSTTEPSTPGPSHSTKPAPVDVGELEEQLSLVCF